MLITKKIIRLSLISFLLNIVVLTIFRSYVGMDITCILSLFLYLFFTYFVFNQLATEKFFVKFLIIFIGIFIVQVPQRIIDFRSYLVSLPEFLCEILGIIIGMCFFYGKNYIRMLAIIFAIFVSVMFYTNYNFILNRVFYFPLFYKSAAKINVSTVPYYDSNKLLVNDSIFDSKEYVLLNIWTTSCAACIAEFSEIDSLYQIAFKRKNIRLFTACILQNQDYDVPLKLVRDKKFRFPAFCIPNWNYVTEEYDMDGVPVTFIIKDKQIVFRGSLLSAWSEMEERTKNVH